MSMLRGRSRLPLHTQELTDVNTEDPEVYEMRRIGMLSGLGLIVLLLVSIQTVAVTAQVSDPIPTWAKTYHATGAAETANSMQQTADGGYIEAGSTNSSGVPGHPHAWVLKLDALGNVVWQKTYGGNGPDGACSVQQTTDGGYIVAGDLGTFAGCPGRGNLNQAWVFKLDPMGNIVWQRTYLRSASADSIQQTSDGGFILAGWGQPACVICFSPPFGVWVVKLTALGNITWQQVYSIGITSFASSARQTSDGGFIVAGSVKECCFGNADNWDALIFKLNATGGIVWQKTYGGPDFDNANSIQLTSDGGFIVAGFASGWGAPGNCIFPCPHAWVFKLDAFGNFIWQKSYGGTIQDDANSVDQTSDGGYIAVGTTFSSGGAWVFKLDAIGNIVWEKGGPSIAVQSVQQTSDGGFVAAGPSSSYASMGAVVVKLDSNGNIGLGCPLVGPSNSTATDANATITTPSLVVNPTGATVATSNATVTDTSALTSVQCASNEPPDFSMSANPSSVTVKQGGSATSTITINSTNGFTGIITLNASLAPGGSKAPVLTLSSTTVTVAPGAPATVLLTVTTKGSTTLGSYTVKVTGSSGGLSTTITIPVQVVKKK